MKKEEIIKRIEAIQEDNRAIINHILERLRKVEETCGEPINFVPKQPHIFDKLNTVLNNYMLGDAREQDVINHVVKVNNYLKEYPHPHDEVTNQPEPAGET